MSTNHNRPRERCRDNLARFESYIRSPTPTALTPPFTVDVNPLERSPSPAARPQSRCKSPASVTLKKSASEPASPQIRPSMLEPLEGPSMMPRTPSPQPVASRRLSAASATRGTGKFV
eukprot:Opistho-1_new@45533